MTRASTHHQDSRPHEAEAALPAPARHAVMLTRISLWAEALARAFWPVVSLFITGAAALALGAGRIPYLGDWLGPVLVLGLAGLGWRGWRRFLRPRPGAALARVDAGLAGKPLATLTDRVAIGRDDPAALALWSAHQARALVAARAARAVGPRAGLAARDPFGLRLMAATALAMALIFGNVAGLGQGWGALAAGLGSGPPLPADRKHVSDWEGWAEPPAHTRRPVIYLNAVPDDEGLRLPQGTQLSLRLYGGAGFEQDIGPDDSDAEADSPRFIAEQNGSITLPDRNFAVEVIPDAPPEITPGPPAERRVDGRLAQAFAANDDYGVIRGRARIALDLDAVDRRFGRRIAPEPREALVLDLPLPARGRDAFRAVLGADLARHPFANLPVTLQLEVEDGLGQTGRAAPLRMTLPGRRFFDPMAAALIELRQALLWSRENRQEVAQILRAIIWEADERLPSNQASWLALMAERLEAATLEPEARDKVADMLWLSALMLEDGGLADALERMKRAQERLSEAIRQGASPDEIARLMRELREATDAYARMQAEQDDAPEDRFTRKQPSQEITGDQLQEMMDEIERLTREGRMAEAQELLEQFNRLMEQLSFRQGEGQGSGDDSGGSDTMREGLTDTLRRQQGLADEALRQQRDEQGRWRPSQPGDADGLADQQRDLREELGRQRGLMQGMDGGDAAGEALDEAGRAMDEAEEALRDGDIGSAMQRQAEAIEHLREGMRRFGQGGEEAGTGEDGQQPGDGAQGPDGDGSGQGGAWERRPADPLGRSNGSGGGRITTDGGMDDGGVGDPMRRARDLLDEIRRRAGEAERPREERDYLGRLLDRF